VPTTVYRTRRTPRERDPALHIAPPVALPVEPCWSSREYEAQQRVRPAYTRPELLIYTNQSRHHFRLESYKHHPGVFDSRLTFVTTDTADLRRLAGAEWIEVATLHDGDTEIGMRELVLHSVAITPDAPSELVQDPGRKRARREHRVFRWTNWAYTTGRPHSRRVGP
jgi:hypothetical protein